MKQSKMISVRPALEQLTTEQLREMLQKELHNEDSDGELFRLILDILRSRHSNDSAEVTPAMEAALHDYETAIQNVQKPSLIPIGVNRYLLRIASIFVALLALFFLIPQEVKADNLWDKLSRWTGSIVEFFSPDDNKDRLINYEFKSDHVGLQQVYDAVVELGITEPVVPMWLPDEYALIECKTVIQSAKSYVYARFSADEISFTLKINLSEVEEAHKYEKDESEIEQLEIDSTTYNIIKNEDVWVAIWTKDNIECSIITDCQEDILHRILGSIYVMEDY